MISCSLEQILTYSQIIRSHSSFSCYDARGCIGQCSWFIIHYLPMCLAMIDRLVLEQSLDSNVRDHDGELYFIWELALEVLPLWNLHLPCQTSTWTGEIMLAWIYFFNIELSSSRRNSSLAGRGESECCRHQWWYAFAYRYLSRRALEFSKHCSESDLSRSIRETIQNQGPDDTALLSVNRDTTEKDDARRWWASLTLSSRHKWLGQTLEDATIGWYAFVLVSIPCSRGPSRHSPW